MEKLKHYAFIHLLNLSDHIDNHHPVDILDHIEKLKHYAFIHLLNLSEYIRDN